MNTRLFFVCVCLLVRILFESYGAVQTLHNASRGGGISKNATERDRGGSGLLLRYVTQGCQHDMNKWIY